jgi:DNA polymerase
VKHVPDKGPLDARIVAIGESPGVNEMIEGAPFVGASGRRLNTWLQKVGLSRDDIYVMNVVPFKVVVARLTREEGEKWAADLHDRLSKLVDPWVIVPMGNLALWALTGKGKVPWHMRDGRSVRPGITDWRGSILSTEINGRQVKTIPTIHPAATFARDGMGAKKAQQYLRACLADWRRIAHDSTFRELRTPHSEHHINPTRGECLTFYDEVVANASVLSVDIETPFQAIDMVLTTSGWRPKSQGFQLDELVSR